MTATRSLKTQLDELHDHYVEAINLAIAAGDDDEVVSIAAGYDVEATQLVAEFEGRTDLLPLVRPVAKPTSSIRRFFTRFDSTNHAA